MAKYIDADKVVKTINDFAKDLGVFGKSAVKMCVDVIKNAPAADVEPVKRGKWESIPLNVSNDKYRMNKYNLRIKCSYCGFVTAAEFRYMTHCHCCGAKMEGVTE